MAAVHRDENDHWTRECAARDAARKPVEARAVAKAIVPLGEASGEAAELVPVRSDVPRLGDELGACEDRILFERNEKGRVRIEVLRGAPEHRREIEAKAVD